MISFNQQSERSSKDGKYSNKIYILNIMLRCHHCFSTIITIAHRINNVLDHDRIVVLKEGTIAEMESPKKLLQQEGSLFKRMCQVRTIITIYL